MDEVRECLQCRKNDEPEVPQCLLELRGCLKSCFSQFASPPARMKSKFTNSAGPPMGPPNQRVGRTSNCISPLARPVRPPLRLDLGHPKAKEREGRNTVSVRQPTRVLSPKGAVGNEEETRCRHALNATSSPTVPRSVRDQRLK